MKRPIRVGLSRCYSRFLRSKWMPSFHGGHE